MPRRSDSFRLLTIGGETTEACSHVEGFDPTAGTWESAPHTNERRVAAAGVFVHGAAYVCGGRDSADLVLRSCELWDLETDGWLQAPEMNEFRYDHALAAWNDQLYAIGGTNPQRIDLASVERYDPIRARWHAASPLPSAMAPVHAHVVDGTLWVVGASAVTQKGTTYDVCALDRDGSRWQRVRQIETSRRWAAITMRGTTVYLIGGFRDDELSTEATTYDVATGASTSTTAAPTARLAATALTIDESIYVIGGGLDALTRTAAVERFDTRTQTWVRLAPLPTARSSLVAVALPDR